MPDIPIAYDADFNESGKSKRISVEEFKQMPEWEKSNYSPIYNKIKEG